MIDGTPWTKVSAKDMVGYLAAKGLQSISEKTAQRSLRRLVQMGLCRREQLGKKQWNHESWYAPPSGHVEAEREDQGSTGGSDAEPNGTPQENTGSPVGTDASGPAEEVSERPPIFYPSSYPSNCLSEEDRECSDEQGNPADGQTTVSVVAEVPLPCSTTIRPSLAEIVRRCDAKGSGAPPPQPVSPRAVVVGGVVHRVDDGQTAPLR